MKYLRTLTEKSTLGFGKYSDARVGNVLKLSSGHWYLAWIYFNCSMINFCDEVMDKLMIRDDYVIKKPGTDPEMWDKYLEAAIKKTFGPAGLNKFIHKNRNKSKQKAKYTGFSVRDRKKYSKGNMQSRNHGH